MLRTLSGLLRWHAQWTSFTPMETHPAPKSGYHEAVTSLRHCFSIAVFATCKVQGRSCLKRVPDLGKRVDSTQRRVNKLMLVHGHILRPQSVHSSPNILKRFDVFQPIEKEIKRAIVELIYSREFSARRPTKDDTCFDFALQCNTGFQ